MNNLKSETIYREVPVSERLPTETGWYSTLYLTNLSDFFWFENGHFYANHEGSDIVNVTHWLEKQEDQVCMSLESFKKLVGEIAERGAWIYDHTDNTDEYRTQIKEYISNLLNQTK